MIFASTHVRAGTATTSGCVVAIVVLGAAVARAGQPAPVSPATSEALALCDQADRVPVLERATVLARGLDRAEEAVRMDAQDAVAHFAVFCNLGKRLQMEQSGFRLFVPLAELSRARNELDVALRLVPDYAAALAAKGEMLVELPRLLGGDAREGELLLRRAAASDPDDRRIRGMLANAAQIVGGRD